MPDFKLGDYQRTGVLWKNEYLNKKASRYIEVMLASKAGPTLLLECFATGSMKLCFPMKPWSQDFRGKLGLILQENGCMSSVGAISPQTRFNSFILLM